MIKQGYRLTFTREVDGGLFREELGPREGWYSREFCSYPDSAWSAAASILTSEIRKLKPNEKLSFLLLARKLDGKRGFQVCGGQDVMFGINVFLEEIIKLQKKKLKDFPKRTSEKITAQRR